MIAPQNFSIKPLSILARTLCLSTIVLCGGATLAQANTLGTLTIPADSAARNTQGEGASSIVDPDAGIGEVTANRTITVRSGDTLASILTREGITADQRDAAVAALGELYDVSQINPGDQIELSMRASLDGSQSTRLVALQLRPVYKGNIAIVAGNDGAFHRQGTLARHNVKATSFGITTRKGRVTTDLQQDLRAANVPQAVANDVISAFAYDPETPTTPVRGSKFTVVYETSQTASKNGLRHSDVMRYADLDVNGETHRVYRYETKDGKVAFMEETGRGVVPFALASPVHKARITSAFGWRIHPVLKVRKFHNGIDFAAPKGTPIYAAEDGVIAALGWRGNYGRFIKIIHNDRVATTYGHMSGYAKGLHSGSHVKKGQIIAYVGSSGLSTGNHLYFEVLVDNKHVDPSRREVRLDLNLDGSSLVRFRTYVARLSEATPR